MHASFFLMGSGVARGRNLGTIDMRRIAPTIAGILGASLPTAKEAALAVEREVHQAEAKVDVSTMAKMPGSASLR